MIPATSFPLRVKCSAATTGCIITPSASAADWESPAGRPMYVVALDRARNRLVIGEDQELRGYDLRSARRELDSVLRARMLRSRRWCAFAIGTNLRRRKSLPSTPPPRASSSASRSAPSLRAGRRILFRRKSSRRRLDSLTSSAKFRDIEQHLLLLLRAEVAVMSGDLPAEEHIFHFGTLPDIVNDHVPIALR